MFQSNLGSRHVLHPVDRVVICKDGQGTKHRRRFEDVKAPLVVEWVSVDTKGEFDDTVNGTNLITTLSVQTTDFLQRRQGDEISNLHKTTRNVCADNDLFHARAEVCISTPGHPAHKSHHDSKEYGKGGKLQRQPHKQHVGSDILQIALPVA